MQHQVVVSGGFDDLRSRQIRFLEEAGKLGHLTVLLWPDEAISRFCGKPPKFPASERRYFLQALRYVDQVKLASAVTNENRLPIVQDLNPTMWVVERAEDTEGKRVFCESRGLQYQVLKPDQLLGFPEISAATTSSGGGRKKVLVTGCYDWFHSGHVRFFEEVSTYGDLYVVVGHDANIRLLKGEGHPLFPEEERRYLVGSIRFVKQALVSTGKGWLDAEPEIERIKPDIYAVNEDGDKGGKREFCQQHGIDYLVLKRTPAPGLPKRTSTNLRGF